MAGSSLKEPLNGGTGFQPVHWCLGHQRDKIQAGMVSGPGVPAEDVFSRPEANIRILKPDFAGDRGGEVELSRPLFHYKKAPKVNLGARKK